MMSPLYPCSTSGSAYHLLMSMPDSASTSLNGTKIPRGKKSGYIGPPSWMMSGATPPATCVSTLVTYSPKG